MLRNCSLLGPKYIDDRWVEVKRFEDSYYRSWKAAESQNDNNDWSYSSGSYSQYDSEQSPAHQPADRERFPPNANLWVGNLPANYAEKHVREHSATLSV